MGTHGKSAGLCAALGCMAVFVALEQAFDHLYALLGLVLDLYVVKQRTLVMVLVELREAALRNIPLELRCLALPQILLPLIRWKVQLTAGATPRIEAVLEGHPAELNVGILLCFDVAIYIDISQLYVAQLWHRLVAGHLQQLLLLMRPRLMADDPLRVVFLHTSFAVPMALELGNLLLYRHGLLADFVCHVYCDLDLVSRAVSSWVELQFLLASTLGLFEAFVALNVRRLAAYR